MKRPTLRLAPPPPPGPPRSMERVMSARAPAAALALGTLLALLCAGEARAAAVCSNMPGTGDWVRCTSMDIDLANPAIETSGDNENGIFGSSNTSSRDIEVTGGSITTTGATAAGVKMDLLGSGRGSIVLENVAISTNARGSVGIDGYGSATSGVTLSIDVTGGSVSTVGSSAQGVDVDHRGMGAIDIDLRRAAVTTMDLNSTGVSARHSGSGGTGVDIDLEGGSVRTAGRQASAIAGTVSSASNAAVSIDATGVAISTTNEFARGIYGAITSASSQASISVNAAGGSIATAGTFSHGIWGYVSHSASDAAISIDATGGVAVSTTGEGAYGVHAQQNGVGGIEIDLENAAISTTGAYSRAVFGFIRGASETALSIDATGGSVATTGLGAYGLLGYISNAASTAPISIDATGVAVTVEGLSTRGIFGLHTGLGSVSMTAGAATAIEAPFAVGMEARLTHAANAAGRVVVTHEGAVKARDIGVLAWGRRSSGHTSGDGAETADDAARTAPMIHVTSSGDVTVGRSVMDAFIRSKVAGADETLSAAEQSVLDAIEAEDSGALDTALAALPDDYDDAWKAEARNLRRKRAAAAPTSATALAHQAAEEILGLARAGVRAMALSHTALADHVRNGDRDPAILSTPEATRTEEQQATLAEQEKLSADERTVLEAALTGGDLEAALDALPAAYTDTWKDGVRQRAASYNAGDIQVDVTGGSIVAEGNGVEALYAIPHDRNGGIVVSVAEGARVTGGGKGIYVRSAGETTAGVRNQTVTVDGAAMGGTGAGVHLVGGGTVTVGANGEVGATSGVGILADGSGDLTATVSGTVTGDIRVDGDGDLTANVMAGGVVTGTIHDPQASFTVGSGASIGRILYASGGTVTVSGGGKLTGVEGVAAESTAGALAVTVNDEGRVEGDIKSGGTLMATVDAGGVVTGTIEDPQASFTVAGSVGRILYASGGTVTVAGGAKLTGVGGVAAESTAGALAVTVNDEGRVEGDIKSGGTLMATVNAGGVVTGTIEDPQASFTVAGSVGRVLYASGGTVTVAATGALTGVEVEGRTEALRSEAGALDLTVAGTVTGDVFGLGAGEHTVTVSSGGTVTGTVHLAASTVRVDGTAGRVRFDNGGTVTVGTTGRLTGIEVDDRTEAIRNAAGELVVSVAGGGRITGDIIDLGARPARVTTEPGSRVAGSVEVAGARSEVRVGGTVAGRVRFRRGGMVTVGPDGKVEGRVSSDEGELVAVVVLKPEETEADAVERAFPGGVVEEGGTPALLTQKEGESPRPVRAPQGGTVLRDPASPLRVVDHSIAQLLYSNGGTVTVAATGHLTGIAVEGRSEAIRSEAGDLAVTISGRVSGDIFGLGAGKHTVTVREGGTVKGTLHFDGGVNRVELHEDGRITSPEVEGRAISNKGGTLEVVVRAAGEEAAFDALKRVEGRLYDQGRLPDVKLQRAGEEEARRVGRIDSSDAIADGVYDVGLLPVAGGEGEYVFGEDYAPRARVYEALPSVVLGLNGLRGFGERMTAPRSAQGGWARVEALRGKWKAEASTSGVKYYRHHRHGVAVGLAGALGEEALVGVSLHHRRGSAEVSEGGDLELSGTGDLELSGTGVGVSGTWVREEVYVDVQAEMTGYEADLTSSRRGVLKKDVSGLGHALGVEAGRRLALERLPAGVVLTPRAGLVHSRVSVDAFSDAMDSRVTVDGARSLKGRVGVEAEVKVGGSPGSRVFGSVEVEHEFSTGRKVRVSGRELRSEADATWLRLGLDGAHTWEEGRYTLQGGVGCATSGSSYEFGGGVSLRVQF